MIENLIALVILGAGIIAVARFSCTRERSVKTITTRRSPYRYLPATVYVPGVGRSELLCVTVREFLATTKKHGARVVEQQHAKRAFSDHEFKKAEQ